MRTTVYYAKINVAFRYSLLMAHLSPSSLQLPEKGLTFKLSRMGIYIALEAGMRCSKSFLFTFHMMKPSKCCRADTSRTSHLYANVSQKVKLE